MEANELADVVAQLATAGGEAGFPDRVAWLATREGELRSGDPERQKAVKRQLREVVHGMDGLVDVYYGSAEKAHRVGELIDVIRQEIKGSDR